MKNNVIIVDDKKGKYMSVSATYTTQILGPMHSTSLKVIGYGATEEEARENLAQICIPDICAAIEIFK